MNVALVMRRWWLGCLGMACCAVAGCDVAELGELPPDSRTGDARADAADGREVGGDDAADDVNVDGGDSGDAIATDALADATADGVESDAENDVESDSESDIESDATSDVASDVTSEDTSDATVTDDADVIAGDATVSADAATDAVEGDTVEADTVDSVESDTSVADADTVVDDTVESDTESDTAESDTSESDGDIAAPVCNTTVTSYTVDPSPHVAVCSPVTYSTEPPTSGPHYPIWAQYKTFSEPVPRGYTVHCMEHGAVIISYHCAEGCDADVAALQAFLDARPADPLCATAGPRFRIVVTPDPLLQVRFAAAAWGVALTSDCFDLEALGAFIDAHYAMAPENTCSDGVDVTVPDLGTYCPPE